MGDTAWLYDKLDLEFHFTVDVCTTPENAKCERFYTKSDKFAESLIDFIECFFRNLVDFSPMQQCRWTLLTRDGTDEKIAGYIQESASFTRS